MKNKRIFKSLLIFILICTLILTSCTDEYQTITYIPNSEYSENSYEDSASDSESYISSNFSSDTASDDSQESSSLDTSSDEASQESSSLDTSSDEDSQESSSLDTSSDEDSQESSSLDTSSDEDSQENSSSDTSSNEDSSIENEVSSSTEEEDSSVEDSQTSSSEEIENVESSSEEDSSSESSSEYFESDSNEESDDSSSSAEESSSVNSSSEDSSENVDSSSESDSESSEDPDDHFHIYIDTKIIEPDCENEGYTVQICSCGFTYEVDHKPPLGHNKQISKGIEPTCQTSGLSDGEYCERCKAVFVEQKVLAPIKHDYVNNICEMCGLLLFSEDCFKTIGVEAYSCHQLPAYIYKSDIHKIIIPDTYKGLPVTTIDTSAFADLPGLYSLEIGCNIEKIAVNAFSNCLNLVEIYNRSKVTELSWTNQYATVYTDPYTSKIEINNGFVSYPYQGEKFLIGYDGASSEVAIPEGITRINSYVFINCDNIKKIVVPESVIKIQPLAFYQCVNLKYLVLKVPIGWMLSYDPNYSEIIDFSKDYQEDLSDSEHARYVFMETFCSYYWKREFS